MQEYNHHGHCSTSEYGDMEIVILQTEKDPEGYLEKRIHAHSLPITPECLLCFARMWDTLLG